MGPGITPLAIVIDDDPADAGLARIHLRAAGFNVLVIHNLLKATTTAMGILARDKPFQPVLVLIDQHQALEGYPALEGWVLAFLLRAEQQQGRLHPCWIAAISSAMRDRHRETRATEAGCHFILDKLDLAATTAAMYTAVSTAAPPAYHLSDEVYYRNEPTIAMLKHLATQALRHQHVWTPEELRLVLGVLSDAIRLRAEEQQQAERLVERLGGPAAVAAQLRSHAQALDDTQQEIIRRLLRREQKAEIQDRMPIGRTKLENEIRALCQALAAELSTAHPRKSSP